MMDVKGWLVVGRQPGGMLAPTQPPLRFHGLPDDAAQFPQGTVAEWQMNAAQTVTLVCVRVPIAPGQD